MRPERKPRPLPAGAGGPAPILNGPINYKVEKREAEVWVGFLPVLFFLCPPLSPFPVVWSRLSPFGRREPAHRAGVHRWCSPQCELPRGGLRLHNALERRENGPAFGRVFIQVRVRPLALRPGSPQSEDLLARHPAFPLHHCRAGTCRCTLAGVRPDRHAIRS